jgi:hypothetical protein
LESGFEIYATASRRPNVALPRSFSRVIYFTPNDDEGITALMKACENGEFEVVALLRWAVL